MAGRVGGLTVAVLTLAIGVMLLSGALQPVDLVTPGGRGPSAAVLEADFGVANVPADRTGYDGQQFYAIAREFPDLDAAAVHLDAPRYRLLRIVAPAIASLGGQGDTVVLILLALNVLGTGLACAALAVFCRDRGWPPGLGYLAGVPVTFGIIGSTADPLSLGLALAGLVLAHRRQHLGAVAVLVLAALTREQVAVVGLGAAGGLWLAGERRLVPGLYALPVAAVAAWYAALGPLVGGTLPDRLDLLAMFRTGAEGLLVGVLSLALSLYGAWAWRRVPAVWPVALGFGLWILLYFDGTFDVQALPRTTAPSLAFGLAAVGARLRPSASAA